MFFILAYQRGFKSDITGGLIHRVVEVVLRSLLMVIDPLCKQSGVLIYKTVSNSLVTRVQPREKKFMEQTTIIRSKFYYLLFFSGPKTFMNNSLTFPLFLFKE